jgi:hypothetical protein
VSSDQSQHPRLDLGLSIGAAAVVIAVLVTTIVLWTSAPSGPARFELAVIVTDEVVHVEVSNRGGELATEVVVRATFDDGSEADQTLTWLATGETVEVSFIRPDLVAVPEVQVVSFVPID